MILPFWNSELYVEISSWFPFGKDYHPVSLNRFHDDTLHRISRACLDLEGEFFFMASPSTGCVGNLPRENFFKYSPDKFFSLGFLMTLGYSDQLERAVIASLTLPCVNYKLTAGITACSLWSRGVFEGTTRVIAVAGDEPFYDSTEYLRGFAGILEALRDNANNSYYAEEFGYKRFFVSWEKDSPTDLRVSEMISDFTFDGTREIVGGANTEDFPPFMGAAVSVRNRDDEQ
ncbi:MAG: hypothetical protein II954_07205 [Synergistaceae bacterium]|nr:hypothetical protein [Synergistaceae bacterium]